MICISVFVHGGMDINIDEYSVLKCIACVVPGFEIVREANKPRSGFMRSVSGLFNEKDHDPKGPDRQAAARLPRPYLTEHVLSGLASLPAIGVCIGLVRSGSREVGLVWYQDLDRKCVQFDTERRIRAQHPARKPVDLCGFLTINLYAKRRMSRADHK